MLEKFRMAENINKINKCIEETEMKQMSDLNHINKFSLKNARLSPSNVNQIGLDMSGQNKFESSKDVT